MAVLEKLCNKYVGQGNLFVSTTEANIDVTPTFFRHRDANLYDFCNACDGPLSKEREGQEAYSTTQMWCISNTSIQRVFEYFWTLTLRRGC